MKQVDDNEGPDEADTRLAEASQWFLRVRSESARVELLPELKLWLEADSRNALAYRQVAATWNELEAHASAPEIVVGRRDALEHASRAARSRWSVRRRFPMPAAALAASILLAIAGGFTWIYSQRGVHATNVGERRALTLPDSSVVTLDARSRIRVDYRDNERLISLEQGQARFDVAKDPTRPFRVRAGAQTVVALGTQFNVELVAGNVLVTMIEGTVAITGVEASKLATTPVLKPGTTIVELKAGEALRVREDGRAVMLAKVDVERATAWQNGRMFFANEPLASAVERVNRYSQDRIQVDPSVANLGVSGVFNIGDSNAFIEAVTAYFPVKAERAEGSAVRLMPRDAELRPANP